MDEVLEKFDSALSAIAVDTETEGKSSFEGLYKYSGKYNQQEERRKEILEIQKENRNNKLDRFRGILELVKAVEDTEIFRSDGRKVVPYHQLRHLNNVGKVFKNNTSYYRPNIYVAGFHRASPTYANVLMMSEWLVEKPEDLSDNWYVVPCPTGVRMLVVATQGITKCYTKYGHFRYAKRTALPGGNPQDPRHMSRCCVLDCFYHEKTNVMYVLDLLAWNDQPMTDGETEFRHFWLQTQLSDIPELQKITRKNQILFKLLPMVPCTTESLNKFMSTFPHFDNNNPSMDGILFYHKKVHYVSGETPLVGWLYPYMVHEILGSDITVHESYLAQKPATYVNQAEFIEKFEAKMNKKKPRSRRTSANSMETDRSVEQGVTKKPDPKKANKEEKKDEIMEAEEIQAQVDNNTEEAAKIDE